MERLVEVALRFADPAGLLQALGARQVEIFGKVALFEIAREVRAILRAMVAQVVPGLDGVGQPALLLADPRPEA